MNVEISWPSLFATVAFVFIAGLVGLYYQLKVSGQLWWSALRGFVQLLAVGYIIVIIFKQEMWVIYLTLAGMALYGGYNAGRRGRDVPGAYWIGPLACFLSVTLGMAFLLSLQIIPNEPRVIFALGGMLTGNSMTGTALALERMGSEIVARRREIEAALALGASPHQSCIRALQKVARASLMPRIEGMRTMGLVHLPGIMTGAIIAGMDPWLAVRYQILIIYLIAFTYTICATIVTILSYRRFFTANNQLLLPDGAVSGQ
jgi:UDP-glucose/iron transport system permease protein